MGIKNALQHRVITAYPAGTLHTRNPLCAIMKLLKKHINQKGYFLTNLESQNEFLDVCKKLGSFQTNRNGGEILKRLKPLNKKEAHPNSLSSIHGLNRFPFHTDGAHKLIPPRFLGFRYVGTSNNPEPTLLIDFKSKQLTSAEKYFLNNRIWKINDGFKIFYSPIKNQQRDFIRLDYGCMELVDKREGDQEIMSGIINKFEVIEVSWIKNKIMIVDNWRMMHSRPRINPKNKQNRILERININ